MNRLVYSGLFFCLVCFNVLIH